MSLSLDRLSSMILNIEAEAMYFIISKNKFILSFFNMRENHFYQ